MTVRHSFEKRMAEADQPAIRQRVDEILRNDLGAINVVRADPEDDRRGVDFWAHLPSGRRQAVDVKARRTDWVDVYLELVSRADAGTPGWAVDQKKITDYVLFLWPKRHLLIPYPQLRATVIRNMATYRDRYGSSWAGSQSATADWRTENVAVPEGLLFMDMFGVSIFGLPLTPPRPCPTCADEHAVGTTCQ